MDFFTYLNQLLKGSPPPTTLGLNVWPVIAPATPPASYCVYTLVSSPPLLDQDGGSQTTRMWIIQFSQFSNSFASVVRDTQSITDFFVNYRDMPANPGIMRCYEVETLDLPLSATGRTFGRMTRLHFTENLPS